MNRAMYEARAKVIKALAHPSRLMVVDSLAEGEKCVCELRDLVGSDFSTIPKHLALMKDAGLVEDRKVGQQVFYRLQEPCILNFFGCVEAALQEDLKRRKEIALKTA